MQRNTTSQQHTLIQQDHQKQFSSQAHHSSSQKMMMPSSQSEDVLEWMMRMIAEIDQKNNKLQVIAAQINSNSTVQQKYIPSLMIADITAEIRRFMAQVQGAVRRYLIEAEGKISQIKSALERQIENRITDYNRESLESISQKIAGLENTIKISQENERNLIKIIKDLTENQEENRSIIDKNIDIFQSRVSTEEKTLSSYPFIISKQEAPEKNALNIYSIPRIDLGKRDMPQNDTFKPYEAIERIPASNPPMITCANIRRGVIQSMPREQTSSFPKIHVFSQEESNPMVNMQLSMNDKGRRMAYMMERLNQ